MNEKQLTLISKYFVGFVTLIIWSLLIWQYLNEGVPSHYLLQNPEFPELSNWWGALLLPVLSWALLGLIKKRIINSPEASRPLLIKQVVISLVISLIYGVILSLTFLYGYAEVSSVLFPGILFFALFFRVYRAEFLLGFILSMSFVFGAVLPTIFAALIGLASAIVYFVVHFIWAKVSRLKSTKQTA
ncbi:hypothetical protein [Colwellia psychrerythraea]|uniref:Uncharacterized protein n=1 Tax=Colwellia psychrerythraea TaxID=28229 RepID=A0A099KG16_COLPS|nr:hypothetical protein [Colwellia psychrerythraea]KGJ89704.1 hypothetical protein GAB14E_3865 [Colwellia psychrerythraea]